MTTGLLEAQHPIDISSESLGRTLHLARRALRAVDAFVLAPRLSDVASDLAPGAILEAVVAPAEKPVARLVARGEPDRLWSEDDEAMIRDLAAGLAEEIRLTGLVRHLEAGHVDASASGFREAVDGPMATSLAAPGAAFADRDLDGTAQEDDTQSVGLRILLADDLDLNRKLICDMLSLDGYVVDSVADGAAAVEAAKAKVYDLILMDMIMPGMDGMDATRAIRALPAPACDVPIVALTAHSFREQLDNCLHAGMNATLTKPMSFDALSSAVATWARSRQAA